MSGDIKILVGVPSSGAISEGTAQASFHASLRHPVVRQPSCCSGPNFNNLLCIALNAGLKKQFTHLAMLHADIEIVKNESGQRWADILIDEMKEYDADFISVPNTIKDTRGLTSAGIGNPANRWNPWRRFTTGELADLPPTFDAYTIGYGDKYLLHNNAVAMWDLRKPVWYKTRDNGECPAVFNFTESIRFNKETGEYGRFVDSEDWAYSRQLWEIGATTVLTSKILVKHNGSVPFQNWGAWGSYENGDEDTQSQWRPEQLERTIARLRAERDAGNLIEV